MGLHEHFKSEGFAYLHRKYRHEVYISSTDDGSLDTSLIPNMTSEMREIFLTSHILSIDYFLVKASESSEHRTS